MTRKRRELVVALGASVLWVGTFFACGFFVGFGGDLTGLDGGLLGAGLGLGTLIGGVLLAGGATLALKWVENGRED